MGLDLSGYALGMSRTLPYVDPDLPGRGRIAVETSAIRGTWGDEWSPELNDFLDASCPPTVHPSLWEQSKRDREHGLFELAPGFYQVRGYDLSNITFIQGETGWIVVDPSTNPISARAALDLLNRTVGQRPVVSLIYTHSHADGFAGAAGVTTQSDVDEGRCSIVAPADLFDESIRESLFSGPAMVRRGTYQFGSQLPRGPEGYVGMGVGLTLALGPMGMIPPTVGITASPQEQEIDGISFIFILTPETETVSEMIFYVPKYRGIFAAELCSGSMHNLVPQRGAAVRDALKWSKAINEVLKRFGADVQFTSATHNWPIFGNAEVCHYLTLQRDAYRWLHDQTLRLANSGLTLHEIADVLVVPDALQVESHTRAYYGHYRHNMRAVYQKYFSWYDGNPAHLDPLPPSDVARRYIKYMGGVENVLDQADADFAAGDFRWVAEVVNHVIFAEPANARARDLQIATLKELGFGSESATFRNAYLTAADELQRGPEELVTLSEGYRVNDHQLRALFKPEHVADFMAIRMNAEKLQEVHVSVLWKIPSSGEQWELELSNGTLHYFPCAPSRPDVTISASEGELMDLISGITPMEMASKLVVDGDSGLWQILLSGYEPFVSGFAIVEP